ncbi:uncharacterized protein LOC18111011 isoform X2 [Populus trichocarpa]|uniref:uncharacterized protein LOC18111011 isoform X2 n=1 Tax=Populus trichocarpa TaxID=3694 RepID=UPI002277F748|nr:uncharacterized protein LOC18111011 isoform X2 [Populus trichocarpa]
MIHNCVALSTIILIVHLSSLMKKSLMLLFLSKFLKTCLKIISHQGGPRRDVMIDVAGSLADPDEGLGVGDILKPDLIMSLIETLPLEEGLTSHLPEVY